MRWGVRAGQAPWLLSVTNGGPVPRDAEHMQHTHEPGGGLPSVGRGLIRGAPAEWF